MKRFPVLVLGLFALGAMGCAGSDVRPASPTVAVSPAVGGVGAPAPAPDTPSSASGAPDDTVPAVSAATDNGGSTLGTAEPVEAGSMGGDEPLPAAATAGEGAASTVRGSPSAAVEALYQQCLPRVEGREVEGECTADTDCVAAGCGSEVCLSKPAAEGMMSTCENRPCFAVLDTCGCNAGRCQWSLKDEVPALGPTLQLDPK